MVIGEAPGSAGPGILLGGAFKRWALILGIDSSEFSGLDCKNLLDHWPGSAGKGSAFPLAEARDAVGRVRASNPWTSFILVGKRVALAFGLRDPALLRWFWSEGAWFAVVPHPSGINRWYNDPENARAAATFMLETARGNRREDAKR